MGQNLYWEPKRPTKGKSLSTGMKWAIQREYLSGGESRVTLTSADVGFLRGVRAASGSDALIAGDCDELIDAIHANGTIEVWLE